MSNRGYKYTVTMTLLLMLQPFLDQVALTHWYSCPAHLYPTSLDGAALQEDPEASTGAERESSYVCL